MSVKQMALVWDLDLPYNKKFILLAYADHADHDGENVYPSLERVAHKTGYSRDQVRRIAGELVKDKLMEKVAPATHDHPARYRLTLERGSKLQPLKKRRDPSPVGANDPPPEGVQMPPEPSVEPSGYEANASRPEAKTVGLEKYITDRLYDAYKQAGYPKWTKDEYGFHLGRAKKILEENEPTDEEIERLPSEFVAYYTDWNPKADAVSTLREMRRRAAREQSSDRRKNVPSWEPINPHGKKEQTLSDDELQRRREERERIGKMLQESREQGVS